MGRELHYIRRSTNAVAWVANDESDEEPDYWRGEWLIAGGVTLLEALRHLADTLRHAASYSPGSEQHPCQCSQCAWGRGLLEGVEQAIQEVEAGGADAWHSWAQEHEWDIERLKRSFGHTAQTGGSRW